MAVLEAQRAAREPLPARVRRYRRPPPRPAVDRRPPLPADERTAWLVAGTLGALALALRLWGLDYPADLVFDEAYYPPQATELLRWGFEYNRGYYFIVHPPLGKWLIAPGIALFGSDAVGWRFTAALAGALAVVVMTRLARRLTGSTLLGGLAGLLLAVDGLSFTLGRIGLLDIFLQLLVLAAVACLVVDRDAVRARIAAAGDRAADGFGLGPRGWRIAAGVLFGAACGVKWSGVYFLAFFAVLSLFWERAAWRDAGALRPTGTTARRGLPGAVWALAVLPVLTYVATFAGWFAGETAQGRYWAQQNPSDGPVPDVLRSFWHMHAEWLTFHSGLASPHPWESKPWSWIVDGRPILLWNPQGLTDDAGEPVIRYILMLGTPTLWALFAPAAVWLLWRIAARRDPMAITAAVGIAAGWLTWFANLERTMFIFYMAPVVPFFVLAVVLVLQDLLGPPGAGAPRRTIGLGLVSLYAGVVVATFGFFYPVLTGSPLSRAEWLARMWFPSWF